MPPATLTTEQQLARDTRDVSVSLSAGAGCGKTHVLTSRFLAHLDPAPADGAQPIDLRQLIAITFTDAAAREMRSRIRAACYDRLEDASLSDTDRAAWLRLLREIDSARVSTIHAFCTALLRSHAAEAGLDPTFGVLEPGEADMLLQEVLDDILRERLAKHDADTLDLAAEFGRLSQLKDRVATLVEQRHRPAFARWCADPHEGTSEAALAQEMVAAWKTRYDRDASHFAVQNVVEQAPLADMQRLLAAATPCAASKNFPAAIATLSELLDRLQKSPERVTISDLESIASCARVQGTCKKDDWATPADFEAYKAACTKVRDVISKSKPPVWDETAARNAAVLGVKLLRLAADVADKYQARKQRLAKLDFDDQLTLAHRLLADPKNAAVRDALSADLRLLLVDEFQDTDPLQVDLIKKICGAGFDEGRLFFVGDFKQSIYRFRGAVPPEFLKLRSEVPDPGRLQLTCNFRSQPGVLHFVNALFHDAFDGYEPLTAHRPPATAAPTVEFLWTTNSPLPRREGLGRSGLAVAREGSPRATSPAPHSTSAKPTTEQLRRREATAIAQRLRELIEGATGETPVIDRHTNAPRPLRPGDVAILFRALSDVRLYEEALREQGLEYYLVGGHAFYAQQEVFDVLNLLRSVASSADDISLAGVLRSPFFALTDESLFWLVEHGGTLNAGLFASEPPRELSGEEQARVVAAASTIGRLRAMKDVVPVTTLLNTALDLTGYDAVLVAEFLGERKLANLYKLVEQARTADANGNDLNEFITQLTEFISRPPKEPLASTSAEAADVIRLMTIHRAKGLEFPFVIVPDLDRPPRPVGPDAALDDELGPLVRLPNDDQDEKTATGMLLFDAAERLAELDERKRLLYVATTRAADYLLLSTSIDSLDTPKSDWMKLIAAHFDLTTGECIGQLPNGYEAPRVHIAPPRENAPQAVSQARGRDLLKMLDDAHAMAADGDGIVPPHADVIADASIRRRQFSFSSLASDNVRVEANAEIRADAEAVPAAILVADSRSQRAIGLGLLVHDVLARLDFRLNDEDLSGEITAWCEHLAPEYVDQDAATVAAAATTMIARFAASPRGRELANATAVHHEVEFLLPWTSVGVAGVERSEPPVRRQKKTSLIEPTTPADTRYIRGYIDYLYSNEAGEWRIIDYKTNEVAANDVQRINQLAERYKPQLYVYALAAEQALRTPPTELVLELLSAGREIIIPWNDAARAEATARINKLMAAATADTSSQLTTIN